MNKSFLAAALMFVCFSAQADEARSFNSIIRAQSEPTAVAEQCNAPAGIFGMLLAMLWGGDCGGVETMGNIDTELPLEPR